ncbi:MAG: hypothetical protein HWN81_00495 [Candidatus Lokiarchaeota archaeon]|nr:hypothetical protein [Candidatus Lokiarchaeota archaeon]
MAYPSFYYNHNNDPSWGHIDDNDAAHGYIEKIISESSNKKCECGLDAAIKAGASGGKHSDYCPKYKPPKKEE